MLEKINNNLFLFRDDLYTPFSFSKANGTKLRQCIHLVNHVKPIGLITYCSIDSPQQLIVATVAKSINIPCVVVLGGNRESIYTIESKKIGAKIIRYKYSGRHSILKSIAKKENLKLNYLLIDYGINIKNYLDVFIESTSKLVKYVPDEIQELYITCGSGFTSSGIIIGKNIYNKNFNINLIGNAPNRILKINEILNDFNMPELKNSFNYIDAYNNTKFSYTKKVNYKINDISLHPLYEAKTWKYVIDNNIINYNKINIFFIIGNDI